MLEWTEIWKGCFLPPGKKLSARLSIVRPLKIESSGAFFVCPGLLHTRRKSYAKHRPSGIFPPHCPERAWNPWGILLHPGRHLFCLKGLRRRRAHSAESCDSCLQLHPWHGSHAWHGRCHKVLRAEEPGKQKRNQPCVHEHRLCGRFFLPFVLCGRPVFFHSLWL